MINIQWEIVGDGYIAKNTWTYWSKRYGKSVTIEHGFYSDGATNAPDISSDCWGIHDVICRFGVWDDGNKINNWQASTVLYDIMVSEGHSKFRASYWRLATYLLGGGAARKNGMM